MILMYFSIFYLMRLIYLVQATKHLLSLAWLWRLYQPNNDTLHARSLAGGSLDGGMQARKTEKGTKRTIRDRDKFHTSRLID
jgi:hypothetical protein